MLDEQDWGSFKRKLKAKTEIDLDLYKEPQMKRRIGSLVTRKGYDSYTKYFDMAVQDKTEFDAFIEYLTINVSEFFRTPEKFSKLETDVIPDRRGAVFSGDDLERDDAGQAASHSRDGS